MRTILILTAGCLIAAEQPKQDEAKADKEAFQGTWQVVSMERQGNTEGGPDPSEFTIVVKGDSISVNQGDRMMFKGKLKLDPSKKPRTIDVEVLEIPEGGPRDFKGKVSQGIYTIDGNTLKWCNCEPGADDRPKEFSTNEQSNHMLIVAKREVD